ncbi:MAG: MFS transporter, partial [Bacteroidales bacterium]
GAMFAPTAATAITNKMLAKAGLVYNAGVPALAHQFMDGSISPANSDVLTGIAASMQPGMSLTDFCSFYLDKLSSAYNLGFGVACISLIVSMAIYFGCRSWFKSADALPSKKDAAGETNKTDELTPQQTRSRMTALFFVFAVVIFFWMAFHQNGSTLTFFARDYTQNAVSGWPRLGFSIGILALIAISIYTLFATFQSETTKGKTICGVITLLLWGGAYTIYKTMAPSINILPQEFQQFNPFFVVALTPFSMLIFSSLAKKNREPSAPRKIGMGMFVAACGFLIMTLASFGLMSPKELNGTVSPSLVAPTTLMSTYLVLTFAELLLSPMGISFVSKVAPPKYKGMMMGFWFAATAAGNYLSSIPSLLWNKVPLWSVWALLMTLCVIAAVVMFAMMKKLEAATSSCK